MPKIVDYDKRKKEIMEQSMHVFIERGYYSTNLSDIAKKCGIGRTTIYNYFKNKDEIFRYAIMHTTTILKNNCKNIIKAEDISVIDKIKALISMLISEYQNNNMVIVLLDLWLLLKREINDVLEEVRGYVQSLRNVFKNLLEEGMKTGEIKCIDKELMTVTLFAFVESFALHIPFNNDNKRNEYLENVNILIDGLKA